MPKTGNITRDRRNATAAQLEAVEKALEHLSPAARALFTELDTAGSSAREQDVLYFHKQGEIFRTVMEDKNTYTESDAGYLRAALQLPRRQVTSALDFANQYTAKEVRVLVARVNPTTRRGLTASHIQYMLSVPKDRHEALIAHALEHSLTARDFHKYIKMKMQRAAGHGRKPTLPEALDKQVQQLNDGMELFLRRQQGLWNAERGSIFANIQMAPKERLVGVREALEHCQLLTRAMLDELSRNMTDAALALAHVTLLEAGTAPLTAAAHRRKGAASS